VVESRRIFRKLKAYVTYRFAATMQIVIVLSMLIFISNCTIDALLIILLALFNDLTMLPIAYDRQQASAVPENPDVIRMLTMSLGLGLLETVFSLIFAYGADPSGIFAGDYEVSDCDTPAQGAIWLQMFIAAELLIFVTRAPKLIIFSLAPSPALLISVISGCFLCSLIAGLSQTFGGLAFADIVIIWAYDILCLAFIDMLKVGLLNFFNESTEVLPDEEVTPKVKHEHGHDEEQGSSHPSAHTGAAEDVTRASMSVNRLTEWALAHQTEEQRMSVMMDPRPSRSAHAKSTNMENKLVRESFGGRMSMSTSVHMSKSTDLRPSLSLGDIRPNIPANRRKY
jgi:hypothetical protein